MYHSIYSQINTVVELDAPVLKQQRISSDQFRPIYLFASHFSSQGIKHKALYRFEAGIDGDQMACPPC